MAETTRARVMNVRRVSSLESRSISRWRWRVSTSASPWCLSGGGRSDFASSWKPVDLQGELAGARLHHRPVDADQVAEVELEQLREGLLAEDVDRAP